MYHFGSQRVTSVHSPPKPKQRGPRKHTTHYTAIFGKVNSHRQATSQFTTHSVSSKRRRRRRRNRRDRITLSLSSGEKHTSHPHGSIDRGGAAGGRAEGEPLHYGKSFRPKFVHECTTFLSERTFAELEQTVCVRVFGKVFLHVDSYPADCPLYRAKQSYFN